MNLDETGIRTTVRTMRIIVGALAAGVIGFGVLVVAVLRDATGPPVARDEPMILGQPMLTAMAAAFGAVALIVSFIAPRAMVANGLRTIAAGLPLGETTPTSPGHRRIEPAGDVGRLLPLYASQLIVASALNEGGAFFALMAYMVEGAPVALGVAGGLVAVLLARFPTADRVRGWIETHLERLAALRRDGFSGSL